MSWGMSTGRFDSRRRTPQRAGGGRDLLPNTANFLGRFRLKFFYDTATSGDYDFGVDREEQKTGRTVTGYTGMPSVIVQDSAITWSQGAIVDRSKEALGSTDAMIIRVRRRLLTAAKELREKGTVPPGVDEPEMYRQRSGGRWCRRNRTSGSTSARSAKRSSTVHVNGSEWQGRGQWAVTVAAEAEKQRTVR